MSSFFYLYGLYYALTAFAAVNPPTGAAPVATEIFFSDGSVTLNSAAIQNLQIALREASLKGKIAEIRVLGWGDTPVPAGQAASSAQISLAEQRSQAVAGYLRAASPAVPVKTANVARRPSALQALLASPELRAQSALGRVGIFNSDESTKRAVAVVVMILR
jgi:hypothetical protein